ncbi:tryptophan halogenase family protein [Shewanella maritima]|uniref:tryptophan halogenase family protein n=1 Tax=Shewanella maritima TaxID=2520507 RepID=UPI003735F91E
MNNKIKKIVILGGGSSGWMTAALLCRLYKQQLDICLIESPNIGTIGVGEATIPPLKIFNDVLGLNEKDFIAKTQASIKLGIQFEHWGKQGDAYMHAFGELGKNIGYCAFHHYWLANQPKSSTSLWDYSFNYQAAIKNKFDAVPRIHNNQLAGITHAYHFDAGLYAQLLTEYATQRGVKHIQATVIRTNLTEDDAIASLTLDDGQTIEGDLFIDCSGLRAHLIEQALNVGYESYQDWLVCDSAWAVPCEKVEPIIPYTRSIAHSFGWQWRIPLQHRTGNGIVFSSRYASDEQAKQVLMENLDAPALAEPKLIRFTPGRREKQWHKNCVAIGLSSGFLEPLESTSLHLVQTAVIRLTKLMPNLTIKPSLVEEYNRQSKLEFEQIRDFIILHYHLNQRQGNNDNLWQYCRDMAIPASLQRKIALFAETGNLQRFQDELFTNEAWLQVMVGQGVLPQEYNPLADTLSRQDNQDFLDNLKAVYQHYLAQLPSHQAFLNK